MNLREVDVLERIGDAGTFKEARKRLEDLKSVEEPFMLLFLNNGFLMEKDDYLVVSNGIRQYLHKRGTTTVYSFGIEEVK